jgi:hypothetical protein
MVSGARATGIADARAIHEWPDSVTRLSARVPNGNYIYVRVSSRRCREVIARATQKQTPQNTYVAAAVPATDVPSPPNQFRRFRKLFWKEGRCRSAILRPTPVDLTHRRGCFGEMRTYEFTVGGKAVARFRLRDVRNRQRLSSRTLKAPREAASSPGTEVVALVLSVAMDHRAYFGHTRRPFSTRACRGFMPQR